MGLQNKKQNCYGSEALARETVMQQLPQEGKMTYE
jgi:hypothetical protein